jgi:predicted porin
MKKSLLALAALSAVAGVASAQSSVTLFGIVDLSVANVKNGSVSQQVLATNQMNSSRLGFRGVEDLGGGLRAGFWLEAAMENGSGNVGGSSGNSQPQNGAASSQIFNRRSTVSLMGGFGEIRLGRDYDPSFWNYTIFDPFGTNGPGSMLNLVSTLGSGATTLVRANNSIGYFLPALGGVYGQAMVAAGENLPAGNKYTGFRIGYAGGPVNIAGAIGKTSKDGNPPLADDYTDKNVGGQFNIGSAAIIAQYSKRDFLNRDQKTVLIGGTYAIGAGTLKASYVKSSGNQGSAARDFDAKQIAFGYQHDLSKRTALYGVYSSLNNAGTLATGATFNVGLGNTAVPGGDSSKGLAVGVRHAF